MPGRDSQRRPRQAALTASPWLSCPLSCTHDALAMREVVWMATRCNGRKRKEGISPKRPDRDERPPSGCSGVATLWSTNRTSRAVRIPRPPVARHYSAALQRYGLVRSASHSRGPGLTARKGRLTPSVRDSLRVAERWPVRSVWLTSTASQLAHSMRTPSGMSVWMTKHHGPLLPKESQSIGFLAVRLVLTVFILLLLTQTCRCRHRYTTTRGHPDKIRLSVGQMGAA